MAREQKAEKSFSQLAHEATAKPLPPGLIVTLLVVIAISVASVLVVNMLGGADRFRDWVESAGPWAPLVYIGLKASTYVFAPLSGTPFTIAGGALFGFWEAFVYVVIGDILGGCMNFWIARLFRVKGVQRLAGRNALERIDETAEHVGGWRALLVAGLLLHSLYDFISYAAGLSNLRFRHFLAITIIVTIPWSLGAVWLGNAALTNTSAFFGFFGVLSLLLIVSLLAQKGQASKD